MNLIVKIRVHGQKFCEHGMLNFFERDHLILDLFSDLTVNLCRKSNFLVVTKSYPYVEICVPMLKICVPDQNVFELVGKFYVNYCRTL